MVENDSCPLENITCLASIILVEKVTRYVEKVTSLYDFTYYNYYYLNLNIFNSILNLALFQGLLSP